MSRRSRLGLAGSIAFGAVFALSGVGAAGAAPIASPDSVDSWVVPQAQAGGNYWTAERMRKAIPGEALIAGKVASITPTAPTAAKPDNIGKPNATAAQPAERLTPFAARHAPVPHIGKVFFTLGGLDYVCSANAVSAAHENLVATAGHCAHEGPGAFASRFTFVPAYQNGSAPYGQWSATELFAPTQWTRDGNFTFDTAFAEVSSPTGKSLSDTVGASGVAFNQAGGLRYSAFGYPAASPFNGETLRSCTGSASPDPTGQTNSQGISCDMTGGSSGGPWHVGGGSTGAQNSVNSFGYSTMPNKMFGPYWGVVIQSVYRSASS